jgi:hypothetical protein
MSHVCIDNIHLNFIFTPTKDKNFTAVKLSLSADGNDMEYTNITTRA